MNEPSKTKILIAEDDNDLRGLLTLVFSTDYDVTDVSTGDKALELLSKNGAKFDVLLTDVSMPPGISGAELVRKIAPDVRENLIIAFLTGNEREELDELLSDEILEELNYFQKPTTAQEVKSAIDRVLTIKIPESEAV